MDTSTIKTAIDRLGRPVARRRFRSVEEKLRIVEESQAPGVSVAEVARRHAVNANLVFGWRRLHEQGLLGRRPRRDGLKLLSVQLRGEPDEKRATSPSAAETASEERWEVLLPDGIRIMMCGAFALGRLEQLLSILRRQPL